MSFESLKHEAVGKFLSAFPASLESLKREALKNLLKNTGMLAGAALAEISVSFRRCFTSLRSVQHDIKSEISLFRLLPCYRTEKSC